VYHGKGGYTWDAVYSFPVWLRKFYIRLIVETLESEKKASKKVNKPDVPKIDRPGLRSR
jgi:hypothetical protein